MNKILLTFDCSLELFSVGLFRIFSKENADYLEIEEIETFDSLENQRHSEDLIAKTKEILNKNSVKFEEIDFLATTNGPGSFTGLRVGISFAKMLRLSFETKTFAYNGCEIIAAKFLSSNKKEIKKALVIFASGKKEALIAGFERSEGIIFNKNFQPKIIQNCLSHILVGNIVPEGFEESLKKFNPEETIVCGIIPETWQKLIPNWLQNFLNSNNQEVIDNTNLKKNSSAFNCKDLARYFLLQLQNNNIFNLESKKFHLNEYKNEIFANYHRLPNISKPKEK